MRRAIATLSAAALLAGLSLGSAVAGDNNTVALRQISPVGTTNGNTLSIDQSAALNSSLGGIGANLVGSIEGILAGQLGGNDPLTATQRGEGNAATLKLTGSGGQLQLFQSSSPSAPWVPGGAVGDNQATITAAGYSLGGVIQVGSLNQAALTLDNSRGLVTQLGTELSATLDVKPGGTGTVIQQGNRSTIGTLEVAAGTSVTYTQIGDGLTPTDVITVYSSNPQNMTITQTAW